MFLSDKGKTHDPAPQKQDKNILKEATKGIKKLKR